ncbi:type II secretion system minor pseudopilin GspK [Geobacter sp. SVR]|uniref:type II secretion system minor pseudopilin GspK n=1 Tax=Geobacter sp. SVR TaxID=2495594 RepID=UPI00143EFA30|nr:type II secretion system minor pseudopilin GspK [Geobacter sp. SVR]BCS56100.1 type II secretion system protein K [Geobacter sp. SVR]GCF84863.1 type II secretion system protein K [Geobacter sp. SVR]
MKGLICGRRGFALVLTLVVTALMVAVAVELVHQVYVDTSLTRAFRDGQQASILAESGIEGGIKLVQTALAIHPNYTSLTDWNQPIKLEDEIGSIEIAVTEESGKINLNDVITADGNFEQTRLAQLKRLGKRLQVPEDNWGALADWIDTNGETRAGGAEDTYYLTQKPPYRAANQPLTTFTELSLVKGFLPQYLIALRPFVTVYGLKGAISKININTAPKEVIVALDDSIDDSVASKVDEQRRLKPFENIGDVNSRVSGSGALMGKQAYLGFAGTIFRIISVARVKETARTVEAVVDVGSNKILSWQEY